MASLQVYAYQPLLPELCIRHALSSVARHTLHHKYLHLTSVHTAHIRKHEELDGNQRVFSPCPQSQSQLLRQPNFPSAKLLAKKLLERSNQHPPQHIELSSQLTPSLFF